MRIALVGYAGSGKTTFFELLTQTKADPGAARTGQVAMAQLHEPRLEKLAAQYGAKKITPASIELHDTPGLTRGAGGENARRLAAWREAGTLAVVVDAFSGSDPAADVRSFEDDLLLADLELLSGALERLRAAVKKPRPDRDEQLHQIALLEPLENALGEGTRLDALDLSEEQRMAVRSYGLLTQKPCLVVLNIGEDSLDRVCDDEEAAGPATRCVSACLKLEKELMELDPEERSMFLEELRLEMPSRERLLSVVLETSGQMQFFTAGPREVRAWLVPEGCHAVDAAGEIHTDMERGFIRVEVIHADALLEAGSEREAKAKGLFHVEGRDYIVQNGDILLVRFSV
jgi:GTP-binding protein YchF